MRLRVAIAILCTAAGYAAVAFAWRHVLPYPDTIAPALPPGTIAYAHVTVTPRVRRDLLRLTPPPQSPLRWPSEWGNYFVFSPPPNRKESEPGWIFFDTLRNPEVRELAFAWYVPEGATDPIAALIVGQRRSQRPDVLVPETVRIGANTFRAFVLRTGAAARGPHDAALEPLRHQPIQALVRPRAIADLPRSPLRAAARVLPEAITASGAITRRGLVLRSDRRRIVLGRSDLRLGIGSPATGTIEVLGFPLRAFADALVLPTAPSVRDVLAPLLAERADLHWDSSARRGALRIPVPTDMNATAIAIRTFAALIAPSRHAALLDGFPAAVMVVDPSDIRTTAIGGGVTEMDSPDDALIGAFARTGDDLWIGTDADVIPPLASPPNVKRIPRACTVGEHGNFSVIVFHIQDYLDVLITVPDAVDNFALCAFLE